MKGTGSRGRALLWGSAGMVGLLGAGSLALAQAEHTPAPDLTAQVELGRTVYAQDCAACHGTGLAGGQFAPDLKGPEFLARWGTRPVAELFDYMHASMPPANAGGLSVEAYAALAALILQENGGTAPGALAADEVQLARVMLPAPPLQRMSGEQAVGGLSRRYPLPPGPNIPDRFANYTPVTQAMLSDPPPENWLTWRRSHVAMAGLWPPVDTVTMIGPWRTTAGRMKAQLAGSSALLTHTPGANMNEPLVRDGVLYVFGYGDSVHAFDAAHGRSLWTYKRRLPEGTALTSKKTLALFGDKVFTATSDNHLVALDARTGRPMWDVRLTDKSGFRVPGGPLAADAVAGHVERDEVQIGRADQRPRHQSCVGANGRYEGGGDRLRRPR